MCNMNLPPIPPLSRISTFASTARRFGTCGLELGGSIECLDPQVVVSGRNSDITNWSTSNGPDTNDPTFGNHVSAAYSTDGELGVI
jgi:hypothetical protein